MTDTTETEVAEETPTEETTEVTEAPPIDPRIAEALRSIVAEEVRAASQKAETKTPTVTDDGTPLTADDRSYALEDMMEDIDAEYDDLPKDTRKAIREHLRTICRNEDVDPRLVRTNSYHTQYAAGLVNKLIRKKEYTPAAYGFKPDEPTRTAAPVVPTKKKLTGEQAREFDDFTGILPPHILQRVQQKLIGA